MHAFICKHMNNPLYFHSNTHLLKLSFKDFPQKPFPSTFQKLCREQCNLHLIMRELYCFSLRWSWCSELQGKQQTYILIYLFLDVLLAPFKSLKISELADATWNPQGKDGGVFPNKRGMPNRLRLEVFWTREKSDSVWAWASFKTGLSSIYPACFTKKWNPCPHWQRMRFAPMNSSELNNRARFCMNVTVLFH